MLAVAPTAKIIAPENERELPDLVSPSVVLAQQQSVHDDLVVCVLHGGLFRVEWTLLAGGARER